MESSGKDFLTDSFNCFSLEISIGSFVHLSGHYAGVTRYKFVCPKIMPVLLRTSKIRFSKDII